MRTKPTKQDQDIIHGKFKSTYNLSEVSAERAAKTFLALLELSDPDVLYGAASESKPIIHVEPMSKPNESPDTQHSKKKSVVGLNYSIEIHLPATKDVEVYNAIFKSLKEHLVD